MLDHPLRSFLATSGTAAEPRDKIQRDDRVPLDKRKQFASTGVGIMRPKVVLTLILLSGCSAIPARAAETSPLKCGVNEDRVWVYDSLSTFDVAMKLNCGEPVEVIGREKGYVKIRTSGGREGYVEAKAVPKPPATEENNSSGSEAQAGPGERQSVVAAARTKNQGSSTSSVNMRPSTSAPASDAPKPAVTLDARKSVGGSGASATIPTSTQPSNSAASLAAAFDSKQPDPAASAAGSQAKPTTHASLASTNKVSDKTGSSPKTVPVRVKKANPADSNSVSNSATRKSPSKSAVAAPDPGPSVRNTNVVLADNVAGEPVPSVENVHAVTIPRDPDDEEEPPIEPLERKESCKIYFSAYGLSPNQYRWMTQNRGKNFSGICPAPSPSMVDFVVIFTHDADFFNGTMPTPVHIDKNGFSDFTPLTTIDTAVVSPSDADKNRREYVWVFHTKRGTFDPTKFSPRRKPLFSTTESNKIGTAAGSRSAEDALRFIEQRGVIQ